MTSPGQSDRAAGWGGPDSCEFCGAPPVRPCEHGRPAAKALDELEALLATERGRRLIQHFATLAELLTLLRAIGLRARP